MRVIPVTFRPLFVLLGILLTAAAVRSQPALNGMGVSPLSAPKCADRDNDGYGTGPLVVINTTSSSSISPGSQTITVGSTTGMSIGMGLRVADTTYPFLEYFTITGIAGSNITGTFSFSHSAGVQITDVGCLGPDADDLDAFVHTTAQAITKWGSLTAFIKHLSIVESFPAPLKYYCVDPVNGNNSTGASSTSADNACNTTPYQTYAAISGLAAGTMVLFRGDGSPDRINGINGTSTNPFMLMGYPGERVIVDPALGSGSQIHVQGNSWVIVDGFVTRNGSIVAGDNTNHDNPHSAVSDIFRHIEGTDNFQGFGPVTGIQNFILEDSVFHDNVTTVYSVTNAIWSSGTATVTISPQNNPFNPIQVGQVIYVESVSPAGFTCPGTGPGCFVTGVTSTTVSYAVASDPGPFVSGGILKSGSGSQAGVYWGSGCVPSSGAIIRRVIAYNNNYAGIHVNGYNSNITVTQNISYSNEIEGITFQSGVNNSTLSDNLSFNNDSFNFSIYNYKNTGGVTFAATGCDAAPLYTVTNASWTSGTATITFSANHQMLPGISVYVSGILPSGYNCPGVGCTITAVTSNTVSYAVASNPGSYTSGGSAEVGVGDQANNLIINNTFWKGVQDPGGGGTSPVSQASSVGITSNNNDTGPDAGQTVTGDLGHNTFRNNLFVNYGDCAVAGGTCVPNATYRVAPLLFVNTPTMIVGAANFLSTTTLDNNLYWQSNGVNGSAAAVAWGFANNGNVCSGQCNSEVVYGPTGTALNGGQAFPGGVLSNSIRADPLFASSPISYYGTPSGFDLRLLRSSPAYTAGSTNGISTYDIRGRAWIASPGPSLGAISPQLYGFGWTDLGPSTRLINGVGGSCPPTPCCSPTFSQSSTGGNYDYQAPGSCAATVADWTSAWVRTLAGSESLWLFGGGHPNNADNSVYSITLNTTSPAITRLINPSLVVQADWSNCQNHGSPTLWCPGFPSASPTAPAARHTYGGLVYIPNSDTAFVHNGGLFPEDYLRDTWELNMSTLAWTRMDPTNGTPIYGTLNVSAILGCDYDKVSGYVICNQSTGGSGLSQSYNQSTNTWYVNGGAGVGANDQANGVVDWQHRQLLQLTYGNGQGGANGLMTRIDLSGSLTPPPTPTGVIASATCNGLANTPAPGLQYNQVLDKIVGFPANTTGGSNPVYLFDPISYTCTSIPLSGGPGAGDMTVGLFNHFGYYPSMDIYGLYNGYGQDAFALNLDQSDPIGGPSIIPTTLPNGTIGVSYGTQTLTAVGFSGGTLTWNITVGSLPPGLSGCSGTTGTSCSISGTPATTTGSPFSFTIQVTNGTVTATNSYTVAIGSVGTATPPSLVTSGVVTSGAGHQ